MSTRRPVAIADALRGALAPLPLLPASFVAGEWRIPCQSVGSIRSSLALGEEKLTLLLRRRRQSPFPNALLPRDRFAIVLLLLLLTGRATDDHLVPRRVLLLLLRLRFRLLSDLQVQVRIENVVRSRFRSRRRCCQRRNQREVKREQHAKDMCAPGVEAVSFPLPLSSW